MSDHFSIRWDGEFPGILLSTLNYIADFFGQTMDEVVVLEKDKPETETISVLEGTERRHKAAKQRLRLLSDEKQSRNTRSVRRKE